MKPRLKRVLAGVLGLAAAMTVAPLVNAPAAYAAPSNSGVADITPNTSGNSSDAFQITLPAGASCPGDSANDNWRVTSYLVAKSTDPTTLTFNSDGPTSPQFGAPQSTFRQPLYDSTGSPYSAGQTASATPPPGPGAILLPSGGFTFGVFDGTNPSFSLPDGQYNIGIACVLPAGPTYPIDKFWNNTITVTSNPSDPGPAKITWTEGTSANAPTLDSVTEGDGTCTANFTPGSSAPPDTSYTATANPGGSTATGAASPLTITGLTNGTDYTVTVTADNGVGVSTASNAVSCTPVSGPRTNVSGVSVTPGAPGSGEATVNWTLPGANTPAADPTGYDVVVSGPTASTATVAHPGTSLALTGLAPGNYTVTVTAKYADSPTSGSVPASTAVPFIAQGAGLPSAPLVQAVTVQRPQGALVLTQVCGVNGQLEAVPADTYTGFAAGLPVENAVDSSTVQAPTAGGTGPFLDAGLSNPDPDRGEYPYPTDDDGVPNPVYPTYCGLDLGKAKFVTRGPGAGQFFAADGVLNQVTVVDTRDNDSGWIITGQMSDFTSGVNTFNGSQLGWIPEWTDDTGPFTDSLGTTYDQVVTLGDPSEPNSPAASGLAGGRTLAQAASGVGLGTAILDARLLLLIPVTADSGLYNGTLSITATAP